MSSFHSYKTFLFPSATRISALFRVFLSSLAVQKHHMNYENINNLNCSTSIGWHELQVYNCLIFGMVKFEHIIKWMPVFKCASWTTRADNWQRWWLMVQAPFPSRFLCYRLYFFWLDSVESIHKEKKIDARKKNGWIKAINKWMGYIGWICFCFNNSTFKHFGVFAVLNKALHHIWVQFLWRDLCVCVCECLKFCIMQAKNRHSVLFSPIISFPIQTPGQIRRSFGKCTMCNVHMA